MSRNFEVVKEYINKKDIKTTLECLDILQRKAISIGDGGNAEVFSVEDGDFSQICLKKIKQNPKMRGNDIDTEFDHQNDVAALGVRVPLTIAWIVNKETNQESIIMERIMGPTLKEVFDNEKELPEGYNHESFWDKMTLYIKTMHDNNYYHCDLHDKNIMIDKDGLPVIIDFGLSNFGPGGDDSPYKKDISEYNTQKGKYEQKTSVLLDDDAQISALKKKMAVFLGSHMEILTKKAS